MYCINKVKKNVCTCLFVPVKQAKGERVSVKSFQNYGYTKVGLKVGTNVITKPR